MASESYGKLFDDASQADAYLMNRPTYPDYLFEVLYDKVKGNGGNFKVAADIATGSGQAAVPLTAQFDSVIGIDASEAQVARAPPHERIVFRQGTAEKTNLDSESIDLITCAQAMHWFDLDAFYKEMHRILVPKGVFSGWTYDMPILPTEASQKLLDEFYGRCHWDDRRKLVESRYEGMDPPAELFTNISRDTITVKAEMTPNVLVGYMRSWSGYQTWKSSLPEGEKDPLDEMLPKALQSLGLTPDDADKKFAVEWIITILSGSRRAV